MMNRFRTYGFLLALGVLSFSCEKQKDSPVDPNYNTPVVLDLSVTPALVNLDTDTTGHVTALGNNSYRLSVTVHGTGLRGASAAIAGGTLSVYKPGASSPFRTFTFTPSLGASDTLQFSLPVSVTIQRADIGNIRFAASIQTDQGNSSNDVEQSVLIVRRNSRPQLDVSSLLAPDTLVRPPADSALYTFSIVASDSDGYQDIQDVFLKVIQINGVPFEGGPASIVHLFDDGDKVFHGDNVAADGRFSNTLSVSRQRNSPGTRLLLFQAVDNSGGVSDSLTHMITIK